MDFRKMFWFLFPQLPTIPVSIRSGVVNFAIRSIPFLINVFAMIMQVQDMLFSGFSPFKSVAESYDFVVIGGGSAGAAIASRLSEDPRVSVLLIEAGGDPNPLTLIPGAQPFLRQASIDWLYMTQPLNNSALGSRNRQVQWPRGKSVGGSSNANAMLWHRGNPQDFDRWAEITGDPRWSFREVEKHFLRIEDYDGIWTRSRYHNRGGPQRIEPLRYGPGVNHILRAAEEMGYPVRDPNQAQTQGFSAYDFSQKRGYRFGTYQAYIKPAERRQNLRIVRYSHATRIHIDSGSSELRAIGVTYVRHGTKNFARARKEIIVSGGTVGSAQLLMLSGIGPRSQLNRLGIRTVRDLPVGQNLIDHVHTFLGPFLITRPESYIRERDLTVNALMNYLKDGSGPLSTPAATTTDGLISTSSAPRDWPNIQYSIHTMGVHGGLSTSLGVAYNAPRKLFDQFLNPYLGRDAFYVLQTLVQPRSVGYLTLRDNDPGSHPLINPRYYSDANNEDIKDMIEGIQVMLRIAENSTSLGKYLGCRLSPEKIPGCEQHEHRSRGYWECLLRTLTGTLYHPVGTCAMGKPGDPTAVVDSQLRVQGIQGLRVADASIMPKITNANTNAPSIMIGEMCADMVKRTWGLLPAVMKQ